jgi:hypothetical protein
VAALYCAVPTAAELCSQTLHLFAWKGTVRSLHGSSSTAGHAVARVHTLPRVLLLRLCNPVRTCLGAAGSSCPLLTGRARRCVCCASLYMCLCSFLAGQVEVCRSCWGCAGPPFPAGAAPMHELGALCTAGHVWMVGCTICTPARSIRLPVGCLTATCQWRGVWGRGVRVQTGLYDWCESLCLLAGCTHAVRRCSRVPPCCVTQLVLCTQPLCSGEIQNCC